MIYILRWVDIPQQEAPWEVAVAHIDELAESKDVDSLIELKGHIENSIESIS